MKKRPYAQRTHARNRTISVRKSAGTKRPRNPRGASVYSNSEFNAPPMNLRGQQNFPDVDTLFGYSAFRRTLDGRPQLQRKYT